MGWLVYRRERVIKDLRSLLRQSALDRGRLFAFLDEYPDPGRGARCELVGWLVDGKGPVAFHWDSKDVWAGGDEYVTGSGTADFTASAGRRDLFYSDDANLTPREQVIHIVLILAGYAVGREVLSGEPLRHRYGGGMEVAVFADGRFTVITDTCFLFWWVEIGAKGETFHLAPGRTILKYVHVNDCLVVYTSRIDEHGKPEGQEIHVVTPIDQDEGGPDLPRFVSGQSSFYCNCLGGRVTGYGDVVGTLILREPNRFLKFTQDVRDGKVEEEWLDMHSDCPLLVYEALKAAVNRGRSSPSGSA